MDLHGALDLWCVGEPRKLCRADAGLNNLSHFVDAPEGGYFLRKYRDGTDFSRVRYEHDLLGRLQGSELSFETPRTLETMSGETFVFIDGAAFALFEEIRGLHPERGNVGHVEACGRALGELDVALSGIDVAGSGSARPAFGGPREMTAPIPDPLDNGERTSLRALFERVEKTIPILYDRLPRQTIHSDLSYGNVLMVEDRVSGILDFEFSAPDLRALDFAAGLELLCLSKTEAGAQWPLVEAFSGGYGERVKPVREEYEALPDLLLLRAAAALVHGAGRLRAELASEEEVANRCRDVLGLEDWLRANGEELVRRVERASSDG